MQELRERCLKNAAHLSALCGVDIALFDVQQRLFDGQGEAAGFCLQCNAMNCDGKPCLPCNTHLYGCNEANRWSGKYVYYCPLGLVFCASSVTDENEQTAFGLVAGPMIMGEKSDTLSELCDLELRKKAEALPVFTAEKVNHLSAQLLATAAFCSVTQRSDFSDVFEQDKQLNALFDVQSTGTTESFFYPIEYEKQLHDLIVRHDKAGAQAMLNELLGYIYFTSNYDLSTIKARVVELVVLLSRAIIDAGADVREIFLSNSSYIHDVEQFTSVEQLNIWLTVVMHRFIDYTFNFTSVKHSDVVHKTINYIKDNYSQKITLDGIAKHVYLSRSYLSTIFKEETSMSITDYIRKVRIEKSKQFLTDHNIKLADIAALCGFDDQSYFTKVFRSTTGMSPKRFRDSGGRPVEN